MQHAKYCFVLKTKSKAKQNDYKTFFFRFSPLGWHTLPSHASAEACLTGWPNVQPQGRDYSVVLRDTIRLT